MEAKSKRLYDTKHTGYIVCEVCKWAVSYGVMPYSQFDESMEKAKNHTIETGHDLIVERTTTEKFVVYSAECKRKEKQHSAEQMAIERLIGKEQKERTQ